MTASSRSYTIQTSQPGVADADQSYLSRSVQAGSPAPGRRTTDPQAGPRRGGFHHAAAHLRDDLHAGTGVQGRVLRHLRDTPQRHDRPRVPGAVRHTLGLLARQRDLLVFLTAGF